jgi:hypothetical protein
MNNQEQITRADMEIAAKLILHGDISRMTEPQKVQYCINLCNTLGLNYLTQPFSRLMLNGKEVLYANKNCSEQLRNLHGINLNVVESKVEGTHYKVVVRATNRHNRVDEDIALVSIENLRGEAYSNAVMKAMTKAKRRVTLSICGLGMLDETEIETIPNAYTVEVAQTAEALVKTAPSYNKQIADAVKAAKIDSVLFVEFLQKVWGIEKLKGTDLTEAEFDGIMRGIAQGEEYLTEAILAANTEESSEAERELFEESEAA